MMKPLPLAIMVFLSFGLLLSFLVNDPDENSLVVDPSQKDVRKSKNEAYLDVDSTLPRDLLANTDFKTSVKGIAKSFAQQSRFPATSMPIENEQALKKYIPNQSVGASLPFETDQGEIIRFGIKTDKYRYVKGETIDMRVFVTGQLDFQESLLSVFLVGNKKILHSLEAKSLSQRASAFHVDTSEINTDSWPSEIQIQAVLEANGERLQVIETVQLENSIASIVSVKSSYVDGDNLVIPVEIDTDEKGYFRLTGVLYSETTNKPLVYLEGKAKLSINNDLIKLKAQYQSLQVNQDEGPYLLKNLWIEKMPTEPDYRVKFGSTNKGEYYIDKHSFEEYSDSDYVNSQAQLSLQFLHKIGGINQKESE